MRGSACIRSSVLFLGIAIAAAFVGCGGTDAARRGGRGTSCTSTDDCEAPLPCVDRVCGGDSGGGAGGGASSSGSTSSKGTTASTGTGGSTPLDPDECHQCVDQQCATEKAACTADCYAIEACVESQCANLSATGSPDEGSCQVDCQNMHLAAKPLHLAYVNCAITSSCAACSSNPFDYDACRAKADAGACASARSDCNGSTDCLAYQACVAGCSTSPACIACGVGTNQAAGQALDFAYETCIATQCLAEAWLP